MFCGRVTDHISSCSAVSGDTYDAVTMKDIYVRRLTGLNIVSNDVRRRQSSFRTGWIRIKVAGGVFFVVDADDLSHFYHEAPVIVREEGILVCVRATGLLT